jgi:hypothetical protein
MKPANINWISVKLFARIPATHQLDLHETCKTSIGSPWNLQNMNGSP